MSATQSAQPSPSRKQLAFLRSLAASTGTTFTYPKTKRQASRQIAKLLQRSRSPQLEIELDRVAVSGGEVREA